MAKKKEKDDRRELLIRYRMDDKNRISFIDPCCDEIPIVLFCNIMGAIGKVETEWNEKIDMKNGESEHNDDVPSVGIEVRIQKLFSL